MKAMLARISFPSLTIRRLVVLWSASVLLAWAGMVGGWFVARSKLSAIDSRVSQDTRALQAAHELESDVFAERYENLLWKTTGQSTYKQEQEKYLQAAERIAADLSPYTTTAEEGELGAQIQTDMQTLREQSQSPAPASSQNMPQLDDLLSAVSLFDAQNENDLQVSLHAADIVAGEVSDLAIFLSLSTAGLLFAGSLIVVNRVVRPALALTNSARDFGQGDFSARAAVMHDDELGSLARTINNMADDIANREQERLRFVAMAVHDLKNPVLAIEMSARMLRESWNDEQERDLCLDGIREEAKRLRSIIRDLTDDVQVSSGRFTVNKARVDLCELVRRLIQAQGQAFADHQVVVESVETCTVLGDADRLERVVQNLVSNAVKYSPRDTRVVVSIERRESFAVLAVCDEGPGISQEDLKVIFQPFGRGRSADRLAEGTGMGLYVVKQIVEAHNGQITVQSTPGQGTTFRIKLPLA
jgi:signal transduction histidine kinase